MKLIAPQYVRPFVKRQKNDAADAEAIVVAAQRPEMRFVRPKTEEQQACAVRFRARERLLHQRTELVNALRSVLYEYGYVAPRGMAHLKRIEAILMEPGSDLPRLVREECQDLLEQINEKTARIETKTAKARTLAQTIDAARRLQTMPGVGPQTALAIGSFAPPMESFRRGRAFAAWLGLVPRQLSSGGKERHGRISKAGQTDIRYLLITATANHAFCRAQIRGPAGSGGRVPDARAADEAAHGSRERAPVSSVRVQAHRSRRDLICTAPETGRRRSPSWPS